MADLKAADLRDRILDVLVVLVVGLRPLITDSVSASLPGLIWYGLLALALGIAATTNRSLGHGPAGWVAGLVVVLLLPAAWGPDGYEAWARWGQWAGHLALALLIALVGGERRSLCLGALIGGCAIQVVYALGQQAWVLPHLAELARQGAIDAGNLQGDLLVRIDHGGVFGSFLLSNALAAFLVLVLPLCAGILDRRTPAAARGSLALVGLLGLVVLVLTRSKGAWVAALAAAGIIAVVHQHGLRRWLIAGLGALAAIIVLSTPALRDLGAASAEVRWGYWQAAVALIGEAPLRGHGLGGFAAQAARVLPLGAEYSRYAHNEVLDAAVAGGLIAGLAVLIWLALIVRRPRALIPAEVGTAAPALMLILPLALAVPYLHVFGLLALEGWPGAEHGLHLTAALGLGLIGGLAAWAGSRLRPPDWALHLGVVALALHCLIDFDLHHGGVAGPLVVLVVLGGARFQAPPGLGRATASLTAIAIVIALATFGLRGRTIENAQAAVDEVLSLPRQIQDNPRIAAERIPLLFAEQDLDLPRGPLRPVDLDRLRHATCRHSLEVMATRPPAAPTQQAAILRILPAGGERRPWSQTLVDAAPWLPRAQRCLAEDLAATGDVAGAVEAARKAVAASPWHLPHRQALAGFLDAAGETDAAAAERARIADLAPQVHFRDRLQEEP